MESFLFCFLKKKMIVYFYKPETDGGLWMLIFVCSSVHHLQWSLFSSLRLSLLPPSVPFSPFAFGSLMEEQRKSLAPLWRSAARMTFIKSLSHLSEYKQWHQLHRFTRMWCWKRLPTITIFKLFRDMLFILHSFAR